MDRQSGCIRISMAAFIFLAAAVRSPAVEEETPAAAAAGERPAPAADSPSRGEFRPPPYETLRYQEDWSGLGAHDSGSTGDVFDPIKYLPLTAGGEVWLSFGGQWRSRVEDWQNFAFGGPGNRDDTFWLNRFLLHADLHLTQYVRCFVQGKSALSTDRDLPGGRRSIDLDELDLQNGFVDFNLPLAGAGTLTLRPGRQEILFGRQRLVGPLDWVNTRRTFDGGSAIFDFGGWKATAFYAQLVIVDPYDFNQPDPQTELWGACASGKLPGLPASLELYFFGLEKDTAANPGGFNGTVGREDRYTTGGHVFGAAGTTGLDFDLEGAYQFGSVGAGDADAFMFASQIGYKLAILPFAPRPYLGFDYASGDSAAGGDVNTFNQLFPTGHLHYGYMDFVGRQNAVDLSAGLSVQPLEKLTVEVDWHTFWRSDTSDALYDAGGAVLRSGAAGSSNDIGDEIDITARYAINRHLLLSGGYSHFFPGRFIEESGSAREVDWGYLSLQYTF